VTRLADVAEHEAAHIVVGLALRLPFKAARLGEERWRNLTILGYTWFGGRCHIAHGVAACAGIVWERRPGGRPDAAAGDRRLARENLRTRAGIETGCRLAAEILSRRRGILEIVARELCDRDLGPAELAEMVLGE